MSFVSVLVVVVTVASVVTQLGETMKPNIIEARISKCPMGP